MTAHSVAERMRGIGSNGRMRSVPSASSEYTVNVTPPCRNERVASSQARRSSRASTAAMLSIRGA